MTMSDGSEMFPLSALLNNQADEKKELTLGNDVDLSYLLEHPNMVATTADVGLHNDLDRVAELHIISTGGSDDVDIEAGGYYRFTRSSARLTEIDIGGNNPILFYESIYKCPDAYWNKFGINMVDFDTSLASLKTAWTNISAPHTVRAGSTTYTAPARFNETYYDRFLAGETCEQWQRKLQRLVDELMPEYEQAFKIYSANTTMSNDLGASQTTTYNSLKDTSSGSSTGKVSDTPDDTINSSDSYAGTTSKGTTSNTNTRTGSIKQTMLGSGGKIEAVNDYIDQWRNLEQELLDDLGRAFLTLIWY